MKFVSRNGTFALEFNSRSGTPILAMTNLVSGNVLQVITNFNASNGSAPGFYATVQATKNDYIQALTPTTMVVQNITGWTPCTRIAYFKVVNVPAEDPTVEVDFEVIFQANDLGGDGQRLNNFVLNARVVDTDDDA